MKFKQPPNLCCVSFYLNIKIVSLSHFFRFLSSVLKHRTPSMDPSIANQIVLRVALDCQYSKSITLVKKLIKIFLPLMERENDKRHRVLSNLPVGGPHRPIAVPEFVSLLSSAREISVILIP